MAECILKINGEKYEVEDVDFSMKQFPEQERGPRYTVNVVDETISVIRDMGQNE